MKSTMSLFLLGAFLACGGCGPQRSDLPLGSDHFIAWQKNLLGMRFVQGYVYLEEKFGGRVDNKEDLLVTDARALEEVRQAMLRARYWGPDLGRGNFNAAYKLLNDEPHLGFQVRFTLPNSQWEWFYIEVRGARFTSDDAYYQDSFQCPDLACLLKEGFLPENASEAVAATLDHLAQQQAGQPAQMPDRVLGSDHFRAMQEAVRCGRFAEASVYIQKGLGVEAGEPPDLVIEDAAALAELRQALLEAQYFGPDLGKPGWCSSDAYLYIGDGHAFTVYAKLALPTPVGHEILRINVHGGTRFSFGEEACYQDSFQSPRLARLLKERFMPKDVSIDAVNALEWLSMPIEERERRLGGLPGVAK
jgi:hypothetical protein